MKKRLIALLLLAVFALAGCDKTLGENIGLEEEETPDEGVVQVTETTTYYNDYFDITVTVPAGYWMYRVIEDNMATQAGLTADLNAMDVRHYDYEDGSGSYDYIPMIDYATLSDSSKDNHIEYSLIIEKESSIFDLDDYVEYDNYYREGYDSDYERTFTVLVQESFTLGELSGSFRTIQAVSETYAPYSMDLYTVSLGDGYFATIEAIYWDDNSGAQEIVKEHILENFSIHVKEVA